MAGRIILGIANPSLDANGLVAAGSTIAVYQNGTTTPVSIYTGPTLATPLANPLTCDSAGRFPQIWCAADQAYSIKWTTPTGSPITYDNIEAVIYSGSVPSFSTGLKTDTVFELTSTRGVAVQGATGGLDANTGYVGEYRSATQVAGSPVSLTTDVASNITSVSLPAGDWLVSGVVTYGGGTSTNVVKLRSSISQSSAGAGTSGTPSRITSNYGSSGVALFINDAQDQIVGPIRLNLTSTTTIYLVGRATFGTSTCNAYGQIQAWRMR